MTVLLVLFTLVIFLIADQVLQRVRDARLARVTDMSQATLPSGIALAANHTWVKEEGRGICAIGFDEFITKIVGTVETITLPRTGSMVAPDLAGAILRDGSRQLRVAFPVQGRVVAVNPKVLKSSAVASDDPYGEGWLVKVRADHHAVWPSLRSGADAASWLRSQADLVKEFFAARVPQPVHATMYDGGEPAQASLQTLDNDAWMEFQRSFTTLPSKS